MADGSIEKKRYEILHWDAARLGEELSELPSSLYFFSIDAEEYLQKARDRIVLFHRRENPLF